MKVSKRLVNFDEREIGIVRRGVKRILHQRHYYGDIEVSLTFKIGTVSLTPSGCRACCTRWCYCPLFCASCLCLSCCFVMWHYEAHTYDFLVPVMALETPVEYVDNVSPHIQPYNP